ncbi:hypothetical protein RHMOL_Rhmol10G0173700 [Rhododendron molle]|uniref:Uncharacterized protein n=1 Tax=Rhododendron molle TaxID=49168 RepID=A0ACC0M4C4_RHOML|nr:hypothetical protein RHMOL_Rhmol10G0173700 [Rhododendron molle]
MPNPDLPSDDEENEGWQSDEDEEEIVTFEGELGWLLWTEPDVIDIDFDSSDALLAHESHIPIPQLGRSDPATGDHLCEVIVMTPLADEDQPMDVETLSVALGDLAEEIRQEGERWLEIREKEWKEQLREFFGLIPPQ